MSVLKRLFDCSPRSSVPERVFDAKRVLDLDADAAAIVAAADAAGVVTAVVLALGAVTVDEPALLIVAVGVGIGVDLLLREGIAIAADAKRSRALGAAPTLVGRAVLRLRITPNAEDAAAFAAGGESHLADALSEHVRRNEGTPHSGLVSFAAAWRETAPALYRACLLVEAAGDAPDPERGRTLDRAMDAILDGTRDRAADAAESLRGPATALYAFGVLLPLSLIAVLPAAGAAGVDASLPFVVVVYDLLLPVSLGVAGVWLLAKRPIAFPPARIGREHPDVPDRRLLSVVLGVAAAIAGWIAAGISIAAWTRPIAAVGAAGGTGLITYYRPIVSVRRRIETLEETLPDGLYVVGRRVADGISVERAVDEAADELGGPTGELFAAVTRRGRQLKVGIDAAFRGEGGALERFPSPRAESAAELLGVAAREGPPAGRALIETADHLDDLQRVERNARRELGQVTSTLGNTAAIFGPLVGGATVALADSIGTADALEGSAPPTAELGVAVGVYVLLLAVILTATATGLSRGLDRATVGYRVGTALLSATVTYLLAFTAAGTLAGGL